MKALIVDINKSGWLESRGFEKTDIPAPFLDEKNNSLDGDYVILKIQYAGVCGSDRGIWQREAFGDQILQSVEAEKIAQLSEQNNNEHKTYRIIGHEFFGEVVAKGSKVNDINIGDMVTCESHVACNQCYQCVRGEKHVCTNEKILGISHDGGFAEFAKVPQHIVWKTDMSKIRPEVAVMQEPFGNAVHAASKVDLMGKTVLISGLGPIGMFLALIAKGMGAKIIIGIEPNPTTLAMAKNLGIDYPILLKLPTTDTTQERAKEFKKSGDGVPPHVHDKDVIAEIMKITNDVGVDVSFEMAGFNSSVNNCLYATRRGGDIVLFGIKTGDFTFEDYNRMIVRGCTLHCVIGREIWKTWETTRRLLEDGTNGIQEKIFDVILNKGEDTILLIDEYSKELFEAKMASHPKMLIRF